MVLDFQLHGNLLWLRAFANADMNFLDAEFIADAGGDSIERGGIEVAADHAVQALPDASADVLRLIPCKVHSLNRVAAVDIIGRFDVAESPGAGEARHGGGECE